MKIINKHHLQHKIIVIKFNKMIAKFKLYRMVKFKKIIRFVKKKLRMMEMFAINLMIVETQNKMYTPSSNIIFHKHMKKPMLHKYSTRSKSHPQSSPNLPVESTIE